MRTVTKIAAREARAARWTNIRSKGWRVRPQQLIGLYLDSRISLDGSSCNGHGAMEEGGEDRDEAITATDLVRRIQGGDKSAETELVERYQERLRHVLLNQMANRDDVEDVMQTTFSVVIVKLRERGIDEPARLGGFIYGVAKNIRLANWSEQTKHQHEPELEFVNDESPGPEQQISSMDTTRIVRQLLGELGEERDRQILIRIYVYEQDKELVCRELNIDQSHLRKVLYRAKRRLQALFVEAERAHKLNLIPED